MARRPSGFFRLSVLRALHRETRPIQDVGADPRRRDVAVTEELLHRADVGARSEQVRREAVAQHVAPDGFCDVRLARRVPDGALQDRLAQVVAPRLHGEWDVLYKKGTMRSGLGTCPSPSRRINGWADQYQGDKGE